MHLYGGIAVMISSYWQAWTKISQCNGLFSLLAHIDQDIRRIFDDVAVVNQLKRDIYQFEMALNVAVWACLFSSIIYDFFVFRE